MQDTILLFIGSDTAIIIAFWEKNVNPQKSGFRWFSFMHKEDGIVLCCIVNRLFFFVKCYFGLYVQILLKKEYAFHPIPMYNLLFGYSKKFISYF